LKKRGTPGIGNHLRGEGAVFGPSCWSWTETVDRAVHHHGG